MNTKITDLKFVGNQDIYHGLSFLPKDYLLITKVGLCTKYLYSGPLVIRDNFTNSRTKGHQVPVMMHWYKAYNLILCQLQPTPRMDSLNLIYMRREKPKLRCTLQQ